MLDHLLPSIPGYTLTTQLYVGSHTTVYRAISEHHRESVVIKVLRSPYPNFRTLVRFRNQYIIAKNLAFPGIVKPLALISWHHSYALVIEDVGGISIRDYVRTHGRLSIEQVIAIALQLADSLQHLSQERVLHKDINPANILIHPDTHQVWLTDFSLASLLSRESQELQSPGTLEGTLAYIAPEQTGRMNRGIDYRADFYSLGVTLYELLTGELPFQSSDLMELIHCHIAKAPVSPCEVYKRQKAEDRRQKVEGRDTILNSSIPKPLSDIVLKLMAKNAEDRYQSALGIKHDLQQCLHQWQVSGQIESFELGQEDRCDRFLIPEKLYGREAEIQMLMDAFERVASPLDQGGRAELMLVAGFSGVGKTAVVNEVHKPITRQKGYFIKGKFDQFNRNTPFLAFVQAFRSLMGQILSESDVALADWKVKILAAVGKQGKVLIEVIPELALIIGEQPAVRELSGIAAQNRFNLLFDKFIQVFTTPDHPLAIFLDDLQWADSASLNLLKLLITGAETGYLLVLGAYRDNEVSAAHPLILTLDELQQSVTTFHTLTLDPLKQDDINHLVAESLHCSVEIAIPLAELVYQKTQGNPFFATQFLQSLQAESWITFNADAGYWQCDLSQIRPLALTDDVVEFMIGRLQQWPEITQNTLAIAACLGNQFELDTLATICEQSPEMLAHDLWPAIQTGLIIPDNETYKFFQEIDNQPITTQLITSHQVTVIYRFLHDRVQQAAYAFIPEQQKQQTHYRIGRFLLEKISPDKQEEHIFDIVNQLNMGRNLISHTDEQYQLISLNLRAGLKAKGATAYGAALKYFDIAIETLPKDGWQQNYPLALNLYENAAEVAYLSGHRERMEAMIKIVTIQAKTSLDTAKILQIKMLFCLGQNQPLASIKIARTLLQEMGVILPSSPTLEDVKQELENFKQFAAQFNFDEVIALPTLTDPEKLAIVSTLMLVIPPTMIVSPNLFCLIILIVNKFSLEYGNSPYSAYGYSAWAILLKNLEQDLDGAYEWGLLSLKLLNTSNSTAWGNRVYQSMSAFIIHGKRHVKESLSMLQEAYTSGLENGDFEFSAYAIFVKCYNLYFIGRELSEVQQALLKANEALSNLRQKLPLSWTQYCYRTIIALSSGSKDTDILEEYIFDIDVYVQSKQKQGDAFGLCYLYFNQATLLYILGDYPQALAASELAEQYIAGPVGMLMEVIFYFYDSLIHLACVQGKEDEKILAKVSENQQKMKRWANNAPMNFQHKYDLVCAEEQRLLGDRLTAMEYYDRAIAGAKENEYLQEEALANELAARFYLDWGKDKIATLYLQEAYLCYDRWGAKAKTNALAESYALLLQPILQQTKTIDPLATLHNIAPLNLSVHSSASSSQPATGNLNTVLDLATIFKSAQAFYESIDLSELLEKLAPRILEISGAERLALLLPDADHTWQVKVTATAETTQLVSESLTDNPYLPVQLIRYVQRTQEILVVDGLEQSLPMVDPYLQHHPHRSVLCLPLLHQTKLISLLYLEHHSMAGVFSRDRIIIINFLCSQISISLENALLKQKLEKKLEVKTAQLQASETRFRKMVDNIPGVVYQVHVQADARTHKLPYISPYCYEIFEVTAEAFVNEQYSFRDFEHNEDTPIIEQMIPELVQELQPFDHQFRIITPSGTLKWLHVIARPSLQPDGSTLWDGILMDVSDRKQVEEQLKVLSTRLELALQSAEIGIWEWNFQDNHLSWNERMFEIYGLQPEAFEGSYQDWEKFVHPDDLEQAKPKEKDKYPISREFRIIRLDGSVRHVLSTVIREYNDQGQPIRAVGTNIDITDRKATELALQESERRYASLATAAPVVIYRLDKPLHISYINERWSEMTGRPPETALGYGWIDALHPDDREEFVAHWSEVYSREDLPDEFFMDGSEGRHLRPDGTINWFYSRLARELDDDGNVIGYIGTLTDITERKEAELALQDAQAQFHRMTENVPGMIFRYVRHIDGHDELTYVSSQVRELFEVEPEIALQNTLWNRVHPDDLLKISHATEVEAETLQRLVVPYRVILPEKGIRWLQNMNSVKRLENGDTVWDGIVIDISDRKQVEEQLKALSTRLELALKSAKIGIWEWNFQDNHLSWDNRMFEIYGVSPEMFGGTHQDWEKFVHPDDLEQARSREEDKYPVSREFRIIRPDGSIRYVASTVIREDNDQGELIRAVGTNIDITSRKAIEIALQESERRYASLAAAAPVAIFRMDTPMNCTYVNDRWGEMTGRPLEAALGTGWMDMLHPDDLEKTITAWTKIYPSLPLDSPVFPGAEGRYLRIDGTVRWYYIQIARELDSDSNVVGYVGTLTDITDRKQTETALAESEAKFRGLVEGISDVIWSAQVDGIFTYLSPQFQSMFGFNPVDWIGKTSFDLVHPEDREKLQELSKSLHEKGQKLINQEFRHLCQDGSYLWVMVNAVPIFDADNRVIRHQGIIRDISDCKATELALQDAQAQFRRMTENVPGMIYRHILHADGTDELTYVSSQMRQLFELEPEIALQDIAQVWARIHPDDLPWLGEAIQVSAKTLQPFTSSYRLVLPEKGLRWVQNMTSVERLDNGDVVWDGIVIDITDRKAAEKSLNLTQFAVDKTALGIFYIREDGSFLEVNESACSDLGYSYEELKKRYIWDINHDLQPHEWPYYWECLKQNSVAKYEINHQRQDGSIFPVEVICNYLEYDGEGFAFAQVQDINERKRVELALEQEVLRRITIFNTSSDGIHILDIKGNLIEANATFFQMLGYTPEEAWHLNVSDWDAKFSLKQIQANLQANFLDPSQVRVVETLHRRKDGSVFPVETSVCSMEWNGQVSFICIARDISERKQAETQLQHTNEELMRATRLKDEFLANMSHELRTPLNSILGLSEALQDEVFGPLTDKQLKYLKTIERNGNHLLNLINDILDVSKIESGQLELDLKVSNIGHLCESSLAFVKQQAVKKSISLKTTIPPHCLNLLMDERRILQSLVNLLNNAVKFTPEGGCVALDVSCNHQDENWQTLDSQELSEELKNPNQLVWESGRLTARNYIKISVTDTGIGIAPEQITKLFRPFSQTDSALNRKYNGTGLGLVLVKQMTELHGGTVSLTSEVGVGSCFSINLPYNPDLSLSDSESLPDESNQPNSPSFVQSEDSPLILLAEDNEDNITVMVSYLEGCGYRLIVAKNGLEAIELVQTHHPDLILMDIQMPELDGLKAIERIRQDSNLKPIPIIALTALAMAGDQERCLAAGANLYVSKPVKLKELILSIERLLVQ